MGWSMAPASWYLEAKRVFLSTPAWARASALGTNQPRALLASVLFFWTASG